MLSVLCVELTDYFLSDLSDFRFFAFLILLLSCLFVALVFYSSQIEILWSLLRLLLLCFHGLVLLLLLSYLDLWID